MNILYGLYKPDSGRISHRRRAVSIGSPQQAIAHGIGMVHQHFMLVPLADGCRELRDRPDGRSCSGFRSATSSGRSWPTAERFGLPLDPTALVADLSVGQQQRVEIVRALGRGAKVLILDEPTAVLTPQESQRTDEGF